MTDPARNRPGDPAEEPPGGARIDRPLEELRELILGPFRDRLDRLQHRVDHPPGLRPGEVGRVLPQAVSQSSARDQRLALALEPITENAIRGSIRRNRQVLVDVLFPVIGPAIRKAVAAALQGMVQSFNQVLEHSLSLRGLKWRVEALRTRRPFAEVVLLHTLLYQVEHVFLIHRPTGLLLQHAFVRSSLALDPDLISGMLTAIRDFVQDSFGDGQEDALDALRVGERSVWIEQGPRALLAAAVRGNPPLELRTLLAEALDEIHFRQEAALETFKGDPAPFEDARPVLENCLQVRMLPSERRPKPIGAWLAAAALLLAAAWGVFRLADDRWRWSRFLSGLHAQPGIVVTAVEEKGGRRHVYGLRDPYAPEAADLLEPAGIRPEAVAFHWEPLQSSHPEYVRRRIETVLNPPATARLTYTEGVLKAQGAAPSHWIADARRLAKAFPWIDVYDESGLIDIDQRLQPPPGVRLALDGHSLHASGSAPRRWIAEARAAAPAIPGIAAYRDDELVAIEPQELDQLKQKIESAILFFEPGRRDPTPGQEPVLRDLEQATLRLVALARELDQPLGIEIIGHSDSSGSPDRNLRISYDRAQTIRDRLALRGVPEGRLKVQAAGSSRPLYQETSKQERALNRRVTFEVNASGS